MTRRAKLLGWFLIIVVFYCSLGAVVYFVSLLALQHKKLIDIPWIVSTQKYLYRNGMVQTSNWLSLPGCITPDPELIYKPTIGACRFEDIEFSTTLHFDAEGRYTGPKPSGSGIAVIGDSHAMGWGVNDEETFAAHLQRLTHRPVYNLAVASYGTARELLRLEKSGVLDKVDTIIVQYCNNDRRENLSFETAPRKTLAEKVFKPKSQAASQPSRLQYMAKGYALTLAAPFNTLSERLKRKDFTPHYEALLPVLQKYRHLLANKRVVVFYSNPYGQRYRNFPAGRDKHLSNVEFIDLDLEPSLYHKLDNHPTPEGHRVVAERLVKYLQSRIMDGLDKHRSTRFSHLDQHPVASFYESRFERGCDEARSFGT